MLQVKAIFSVAEVEEIVDGSGSGFGADYPRVESGQPQDNLFREGYQGSALLLPWYAQFSLAVCSGLAIWILEVLLTFAANKVGQYLLRHHHTGKNRNCGWETLYF